MHKIRFQKENRTIKVEPGENLRKAAIRNKFSIYAHIHKILNCRGRGLCTACAVQIVEGSVDPRNDIETEKLAGKPTDFRMACQISVNSDLVVKTHP